VLQDFVGMADVTWYPNSLVPDSATSEEGQSFLRLKRDGGKVEVDKRYVTPGMGASYHRLV
jgi:hypothetical protein